MQKSKIKIGKVYEVEIGGLVMYALTTLTDGRHVIMRKVGDGTFWRWVFTLQPQDGDFAEEILANLKSQEG